jgi:hypothetical protein
MPHPDDILTDGQFDLVSRALDHPHILRTRAEKVSARSLEKRGYGTVESGASGDVIFRLNQDGSDAVDWLRELRDIEQPENIGEPWLVNGGAEA